MSTVFLFPGQGAQYPGMARDLYEGSDEVKNLFSTASGVLNKDMAGLLFDGSEEDLKSTDNTQAAVTLANISASAVLKEKGVTPAAVMGFSVGEYAALHEAGVLDTETLFRVVQIRGEVMEKGARKADTAAGPSAMSAVLGLPFEEARDVVSPMAGQGVFIANHSSPTQIVIAGTSQGLDAAEAALNDAGAMKVVRLKVSGPFHSPLLEDARTEFEERIGEFTFHDPRLPLISNVSATPIENGEQARKRAGEQIVSMVRWVDSEQYLLDKGFITGGEHDLVIEAGPGKVLCGLWKSFYKGLRGKPAGTLEAIEKILQG
ncbi:ACP S-malonyltransferase [Salinispira pacifica]|uniref:Malonyl CoA-acyl carrier protein transacylase n=1 Tax=Salinispira pacifica TaxID=1307761 RepID=V5WDY6_9SPIO|nr:ACP S-malonyltransferase [Salinispira pacifica]AHC13845.1 Malonyl CoA-acyl carrier protein transacylase [Salinispira pacifica]